MSDEGKTERSLVGRLTAMLEAERAAHEETKRERDELAWAAVGALMVLDDMDRSSLEIESRRPRFAWDERALMREWARAAIAKAEGER